MLFDRYEFGPLLFTGLAIVASVVAALASIGLVRTARRVGLVSRSRRDRFGLGKVPLTGGPGLLLGIAAPLLMIRHVPRPGELAAIGGFFLIGLLDDLYHWKPARKLAAQAAVGAVAAWLLVPSLTYVAFVFVVLVLLVNASNYLDNMDGLLAGVALTQAVALVQYSVVAGLGGLVLLWSLPALVFLTLPPARVYLGDSGSHLVGALLGLDAVRILFGYEGPRAGDLLPLLVLFAVPLADVATVTVSRLRRKRPLLRGGTDHLSHRLVRLGFPVPRAVLVLVLASGVCGVASLLLARAS